MAALNGCHHITMGVGGAQEDVDFHVKMLGMRFIKRTVLFDGEVPVYHLYYSNKNGDPSSIVTTFPFQQAGMIGKRGTNQAREVLLAAPARSLDFWKERLSSHRIEVADVELLNMRRLRFRHPSGVEYALVGVEGDTRAGNPGSGVPEAHAIHGVYGIGVHVHTPDLTSEFLIRFLSGKALVHSGDLVVVDTGSGSQGGVVELSHNKREDQGTWTYAAGTIHHFAFNARDLGNQDQLKFAIEGAGYTDMSELRDRKYFKSVYVRAPGGLLCELAVTHPEGGWTCDESPQELGKKFQLPSQFESRRAELLGRLEAIEV